MRVTKIQVVYHPAGGGDDPLLQRATLGLKVEVGGALTELTPPYGPYKTEQHGVYFVFDREPTVRELVEEVSFGILFLVAPDKTTLLHEGTFDPAQTLTTVRGVWHKPGVLPEVPE